MKLIIIMTGERLEILGIGYPTDDLYQLVQASHGIVFFLCVKYIAMIHSTRNTTFPIPFL